MKSRRSVIRAILFMLRLQKSVSLRRESTRNASQSSSGPSSSNHHPSHHGRFLSRAESTRHRRRSSQKQSSQHRNSAPGGALPHRSPSLARLITKPATTVAPDAPVHFGAFSAMSQPYSLGLSNARGAPILSVCAGAAHTLASTALLCRQQSLDEYASRSLISPLPGTSSTIRRGTISVQRQTSVETSSKSRRASRNVDEDEKKAGKTNMISLMSAIIAIEQDDSTTIGIAIRKGLLDPSAVVAAGAFAQTSIKWTLMDVALALDAQKCARLLMSHGALENEQQSCLEARRVAVNDAVERIEQKRAALKSLSPRDYDKQVKSINTHRALFTKMERTLAAVRPARVESCKIEANSAHSILLRPVIAATSASVVYKYKVEWSDDKSFTRVLGSAVVGDIRSFPIEVHGIDSGSALSFRVFAGTIHDYGDPIKCVPPTVEMSSWEELFDERESREDHAQAILNLTDAVEKHRQSLVWQRVFPNESEKRRKKNGIKDLFVSSAKFAKNMQSGVYLAALIYCEGRILCTVDDVLPCFVVDETISTLNKEDIQWLLKLSLSWDQLSGLSEATPNAYSNNIALNFRAKVINAANDLMNALGLKDIGRLAQPVVHESCVFLVTVRFVPGVEAVTALTTHWMTFEKMLRKRVTCPAMDKLIKETVPLMNFFESSQIPLERGLYVSYMKLHSSLSSIRVVVPDNLPSVLPYVSVRDNPHVTKDEWDWIMAIDENRDVRPTPGQRTFHRQLSKAINTLLHDLDVDPDLVPGHRMLTTEILQLNKDVSLILILPKPEDVCSAPTGSTHATEVYEQRRGCTSISILVFEMIHLSTYHPAFINSYCKLSIFIEHFLMISQYEQRKCLLENDSKVYRTQSEILSDYQRQLDSIWGNSRWISRIASLARDKTAKCSIPLSRLLAPLANYEHLDGGYQSDNSTDRPDSSLLSVSSLARFPRPQSLMGSPTASLSDFDRILSLRRHHSTERPRARNALSQPIAETSQDAQKTAVIIVYAAYDCGLAKGTSVRLSITPATTSHEIVGLVVEQLAKVSSKAAGRPVEEVSVAEDLKEYCLAVVIGARERRLRDDFALLKLQNPWAKGKIFVRRKDSVTAAVEAGNEAVV